MIGYVVIKLVKIVEDRGIIDGGVAIAARMAAKALTRVIDTVMTSTNG